MIKIIFLDIDNTLYSHKSKEIPSSAKEAVLKAQEKGIKIILATGRSMLELEDLDYEGLNFDGYITNNGQICYNIHKEVIYDEPIAEEDLKVMLPYFIQKEKSMLFINLKDSYMNYVNDAALKAQKTFGLPCPPIMEYTGEKIYQIVLYSSLEEANQLLAQMPDSKMTQWCEEGFDILSKYGSKSKGILETLKYFHLEHESYMAVGDAINDLEMIEKADYGVAMGNACEALKEKANYITSDIDEDGLYNAFKYYGVI